MDRTKYCLHRTAEEFEQSITESIESLYPAIAITFFQQFGPGKAMGLKASGTDSGEIERYAKYCFDNVIFEYIEKGAKADAEIDG